MATSLEKTEKTEKLVQIDNIHTNTLYLAKKNPENQRRRSCASAVLTTIGLLNGNPAFLTPPTELTSLKKFVTGDYVHDFYSCAKIW